MENTHVEEHGNGSGLTMRASEKVREISEAAREQAGERVRRLSEKARERAQEQVESQRERLASRVNQAASSLMQHAEEGENLRFEAERRVAHGLENAAGYLQSHQTAEVAGDVAGFVREHPVKAMIIAAIIGFLLGKLLS